MGIKNNFIKTSAPMWEDVNRPWAQVADSSNSVLILKKHVLKAAFCIILAQKKFAQG